MRWNACCDGSALPRTERNMHMKIICLGDSLTYGMGVPRKSCWVSLTAQATGHTLINRGICGDTTGGMLARYERDVLSQSPNAAILLGGGNDIVSSEDTKAARANLFSMMNQASAAGILPILATPLPYDVANMSPDWAALTDWVRADDLCREYAAWICLLGKTFGVPVVDFHALFCALPGPRSDWYLDGLHPNEGGQRRMAEAVCAVLTSKVAGLGIN